MCLIGQQRTYPPQEEAAVDLLRQQFLDERCGRTQGRGCDSEGEGPDRKWASGFTPRESREPVKNCSKVNRDVSRLIAETITNSLLRTENLVSIEGTGGRGDRGSPGAEPRKWNVGGEDMLLLSPSLSPPSV